jgi:hypothetical protein
VRRRYATSLAVIWSALLLSCRDASSSVIPSTPLGRYAVEWLSAHNRGDTHSIVHFTVTHRGSVRMTPLQEDGAVHEGVQFAREIGPLVALKVLASSDTALAVLLRTVRADSFAILFKPASQPGVTPVLVQVDRSPAGRTER